MYNRPWTSIQDLFQPNSWQTPVAAVTVYSAPDDGRKGCPKHVEEASETYGMRAERGTWNDFQ